MRPDADSAIGERHEDDAWFATESATTAAGRDRRAQWMLGALIAVLLLLGWGLGAFSGDRVAEGSDRERLRARAKAAASASPLAAEGGAALLQGLDRLLATIPPPAPEADATTGNEVAEAAPSDAGGAATGGDGRPTVAAAEPQVAAPEPRKTEPAPSAEAAPKPAETKKAEPKAEPKKNEPKVVETLEAEPKKAEPKKAEPELVEPKAEPKKAEPKAVETPEPKPADDKPLDPKAKASVDQALTDAKADLDAGRWNQARAGYDKVLKAAPGNPRALLGRGRALLELRQVQPALKDLRAVLEVEPKNPTALLFAGTICQELGQREQARGYYQRYLDAWPSGRKASEVKALLERL